MCCFRVFLFYFIFYFAFFYFVALCWYVYVYKEWSMDHPWCHQQEESLECRQDRGLLCRHIVKQGTAHPGPTLACLRVRLQALNQACPTPTPTLDCRPPLTPTVLVAPIKVCRQCIWDRLTCLLVMGVHTMHMLIGSILWHISTMVVYFV